jgi:hypothetical protein
MKLKLIQHDLETYVINSVREFKTKKELMLFFKARTMMHWGLLDGEDNQKEEGNQIGTWSKIVAATTYRQLINLNCDCGNNKKEYEVIKEIKK